MIIDISESIKIAVSANKAVIRQDDKFEGKVSDVSVHDRAEAIALANALMEWASQQEQVS